MSDPLRIIAQSIGTYPNDSKFLERLAAICREHDVGLVVVGMPLTLRGAKGAKATEVDQFIERLKTKLGIEIVTWDERFTSRVARQTLIDMGTKKKQRRTNKGLVDAVASALILQSFLDQTKHSVGC